MDSRHFVGMLAGAALPLSAARLALGQPQSADSWQNLQKLLNDYVGAKKLLGAGIAVTDNGSPLNVPQSGKHRL